MNSFIFNTPCKIISQLDGVDHLKDFLLARGCKRPLIITDLGIKKCGLLKTLLLSMKPAFSTPLIFDQVSADPSESTIKMAIEFAKTNYADAIIGFGGGSSMDTAKLVAIQAFNTQPLHNIYGLEQIDATARTSKLPLVLIPTTAGTGSEATAVAIVTTGETSKAGIVSELLYPDLAILDAKLTIDLPTLISAATGVDAMVHAIEAFTSKVKKNVYSDMFAKQALSLLSSNILRVHHHPHDIDARQAMLVGACMAGQAFANAPVAAVHALAYPLGGRFHIPHGLSNALVLTHVMRFNASEAHSLYCELATCVGLDLTQFSDSESAASAFIGYFESLIETLEMPTTLRSVGINEDDISMLANDAMLQTRLLINNPKNVAHADAVAIYTNAL